MGQLAIAFNSRPHGVLPSNIKSNPRREVKMHFNAIMLRNGKELHPSQPKWSSIEENENMVEEKIEEEKKQDKKPSFVH